MTQKHLTLPSAKRAPGVPSAPPLCAHHSRCLGWQSERAARSTWQIPGPGKANSPGAKVWAGRIWGGQTRPARSSRANCGCGQCEGDVWPHLFRGCLVSGLAWPTPSRERVSHVRAGGRASEQERSSGWAWGWRGDGRGRRRAVGGDGQLVRLAVLTDRPDLHLGELE